MARFRLVVLSNPRDGRDDEFNDWYDNVHLKDVLAVDGIVAARRFKLSGADQWRYLALYDMECDEPQVVVQELLSRAGTDRMTLSDAFDMDHYFMAVAEPISELGPEPYGASEISHDTTPFMPG